MQTPTELLNQWEKELTYRQLSPHTIESYLFDIKDFLKFCEKNSLSLQQLQRADLQQYLVEKVENQLLQNKSLQRRAVAIRQFMQWLHNNKIIQHLPTQALKVKTHGRKLPSVLDENLVQQLLDQPAPTDPKENELWIRDKAMLELLYSSGLRLAELQAITLKDIDFGRKLLRVHGKGKKQRNLPFGSKAMKSILAWLKLNQQKGRQLHPDSFLFIGKKKNENDDEAPISRRQIENRVKYQAQRAGLPVNLHPHLLRHSFASHMLARSGELRAIQELLGHSNLDTTQIYTHLNFAELQQEYLDKHPRARSTGKI